MENKELNKYPDFSVLMSVYNKENPQFLDQALCSIEDQTVVPTEIVLVEDGPLSDELSKVIEQHKANFINTFKVVNSKRNQGLGASLRLGTKFISTNWIARMDSDDISVHNRFELQLKEIIKNPELAVIGGQIQEFSRDPSVIVGYRKVPTSEPSIRRFIKWRSPFNHPSVMLNKTILNKVGGYVPYGNLEDYYLWARIIADNYHVLNLDETLVSMRVDQGLYNRRGKCSNLQFIYNLRKYLEHRNIINHSEKIAGDIAMTLNIIMPNSFRKTIYKKILHKAKRKTI